MNTVKSTTTVSNVTRLNRLGVGPVYRAVVPIAELHALLKNATVRYAPKYQRGFKQKLIAGMAESEYDRLFPINDEILQISPDRARSMAVKYLKAANNDKKLLLFSTNVTWNARKENGEAEAKFDPQSKTLTIQSTITIPDTGHRHNAYYLIGHWKEHPEEIPAEVMVNDEPISQAEIKKLLAAIDLNDTDHHSVYVDIYCLDKIKEGWLYDEFNADAKPPSRAVALDLNKEKTPTRRFVWSLIATSSIFSRDEVEARSTTIAAQSRKLTTTSTLDSAIKPFTKKLVELERARESGQSKAYDDLIAFFAAFYDEWATHFPAFAAGASSDARKKMRDETFAASNIMFFPMFRLAFETWQECQQKKIDWRKSTQWKAGLAKLAGNTKHQDEETGKKLSVMSRRNPEWQGKILIQTFDSKGKPLDWSLSSTRQTREAAYAYLKSLFGQPT